MCKCLHSANAGGTKRKAYQQETNDTTNTAANTRRSHCFAVWLTNCRKHSYVSESVDTVTGYSEDTPVRNSDLNVREDKHLCHATI